METPATIGGHATTLDDYYTPTPDELRQFHSIDRQLYSTMVFSLRHDPILSLHLLALFLYQERNFPAGAVVGKLIDQPLPALRTVLSEAATCLRRIADPTPQPDPTIEFIRQHVKNDIVYIVNTVCVPAVSDIKQKAMKSFSAGRKKHGGGGRWPEGRTMFMTFSKGYPVEEWEVREFLANRYGDLVESIHMAVPTDKEPQPLNAHIVLRSADSVSDILRGDLKSVVRFSIHGKDARLRKYDHDRRKY